MVDTCCKWGLAICIVVTGDHVAGGVIACMVIASVLVFDGRLRVVLSGGELVWCLVGMWLLDFRVAHVGGWAGAYRGGLWILF